MIRWFRSFPYFLRESLAGIRESGGVAVIAVATATISLVILGALWVVQVNLSALIENWRERFQLTFFLEKEISTAKKAAIRKTVLGDDNVERIEEITSDQALAEFRGRLGANADLLDGFEDSFLPSSFRVILKPERRDMAHIEALLSQVRILPGIDRVRNDLVWLRRLEGAIGLVRLSVLTISALLGLGVVFIVANTIRLTLFARRDDIAIMHLVGATDFFIKTPCLIEGVLCGFLGGALASLALWGIFHGLFVPVAGRFAGEGIPLASGGWNIGMGLILTGGALGYLGSTFSVKHFLRTRGR